MKTWPPMSITFGVSTARGILVPSKCLWHISKTSLLLIKYEIKKQENVEGKLLKIHTCYGQTGSQEYFKSREEAISIKKQMNDGALLRFFNSTIARQPSASSSKWHLGERYTTIRWGPGVVSKTVRRIFQQSWPFHMCSNL